MRTENDRIAALIRDEQRKARVAALRDALNAEFEMANEDPDCRRGFAQGIAMYRTHIERLIKETTHAE